MAATAVFSVATPGQVRLRQVAPGNAVRPAAPYVHGEVLVRFRSPVSAAARRAVMENLGDRPVKMAIGTRDFALVRLRAGATVGQAMASYRAMAEVESVQPNYIYHTLLTPNDPSYGELWGLHNAGQTVTGETYASSRVSGSDIGAEQAWDVNGGDCSSMVVAVLDSGVNYTHEDLAANMWDGSGVGYPNHGANFVTGENSVDPMPVDADGHGTHVAATIGAVGNNSLGTTGVCWSVQLMALRALTVNGGTTASIIAGLNFAVTHGAKIVNMSFGGSGNDPAFESEIVNARDNGVILVVAAGNGGVDNDNPANAVYPCSFPEDNIICVAALDQAYNRASFSNFGATTVDVGAPGTNILSAWPGKTVADNLSGGWTLTPATGGWAEVACSLSSGIFNLLVDPSGFCSPSFPTYATNANHVIYKSFDLSGTTHASLGFFRFLDTESGQDFLGFAHSTAAGDPFASNPGSVTQESGSSGGFAEAKNISLDDCLTASCSVGFRLQSNSTTTTNEFGVGILVFEINTTQSTSNVYQVLNGTSMATPHVTGVAATVWARNPSYTYADVVNSVKSGGDVVTALQGNTVTGRAVDANGSLRFIEPPTSVSAVVSVP
jgi:thermitase